MFSSALQLTSLDDFITPSQACVNPAVLERASAAAPVDVSAAVASTGNAGSSSIGRDFKPSATAAVSNHAGSHLQAAKISLNDCLACSGCVTTAETVLVTSQSVDELLSMVANKGDRCLVVSISPQSRASLATKFGISMASCQKRLTTFFKSIGASAVLDTAWSRDICLLELRSEFCQRFRSVQSSVAAAAAAAARKNTLPLLASSCPGWICYAEKSHGEYILPYISTVKSPQQVLGALVKRCRWGGHVPNTGAGIDAATVGRILHVCIMPCFDKKLEAARPEFASSEGDRDVDIVLASLEIADLLERKGIASLATDVAESPIDTVFNCYCPASDALQGYLGSGSGGYADYLFRAAALDLFGMQVTAVPWRTGRNPDVKEAVLELPAADGADGCRPVLRFAVVNGFRNIQNLIRKLKQGTSEYDFVEVMACPGGCLNGGGQIRPATGEIPRLFLERVAETYFQMSSRDPDANFEAVRFLLEEIGPEGAERRHRLLRTSYRAVPKLAVSSLAAKW